MMGHYDKTIGGFRALTCTFKGCHACLAFMTEAVSFLSYAGSQSAYSKQQRTEHQRCHETAKDPGKEVKTPGTKDLVTPAPPPGMIRCCMICFARMKSVGPKHEPGHLKKCGTTAANCVSLTPEEQSERRALYLAQKAAEDKARKEANAKEKAQRAKAAKEKAETEERAEDGTSSATGRKRKRGSSAGEQSPAKRLSRS